MAILSRAAMKTKLDAIMPGTNGHEYATVADIRNLLRDHIDSGGNSTATTSAEGVSELATAAEINTGTDAARTITPDTYAESNLGKRTFSVSVFGPAVDTATGDGKQHWNTPAEIAGMNLVAVSATNGVVGTTGQLDVQIHNLTQTADMLSTVISIDTIEPSSTTAAVPAVIDAAQDDITAGDVLRFDVDAVHSGTAAKGLTVNLTFQLP